jgi:small subunit ribosomal protein S6
MSKGGVTALRTYELMVIHRPELPEDDVRVRVEELERILVDQGATITESDFWGKRRFAYEIDHIHEGYYSVVTFEAEPETVDLVDRTLALADVVVRHKVIRPEVSETTA